MSFLRPIVFYPVCIVIGGLVGLSIIGLGLVSPKDAAPVSTPVSRNLERTNTLKSLAAALQRYQSEHQQRLPVRLPSSLTEICISSGEICVNRHLVDLSYLTADAYLESLPTDPVGGRVEYGTGYFIAQSTEGVLYLKAARAEDGKTIELIK
jgi:hypothetical protein